MKGTKILLVDDEEQISAYLNRKLTRLGYEVYVAGDGEEALNLAFSSLPDIVLLDVKMPKMSGIEVCKRLRSDGRTETTPIIMLSAKAQSDEIQAGLDAGANRYLCKPLGFPDILSEIEAFRKMLAR
ncbi:MAG: response regulator [Desulfobacteraceae bacterium]|jgi:DNA-binding response OmpR family regulator